MIAAVKDPGGKLVAIQLTYHHARWRQVAGQAAAADLAGTA